MTPEEMRLRQPCWLRAQLGEKSATELAEHWVQLEFMHKRAATSYPMNMLVATEDTIRTLCSDVKRRKAKEGE